MGSLWSEAASGYAGFASSLLKHWRPRDSSVDERAEKRPRGEVRTGASNAFELGLLAAMKTLDVVAVLTGRQHEAHIVESEVFSTSLAGATLAVGAPLISGHGSELPADAITLEPRVLSAASTNFRLRADATGRHGATYLGSVVASRSDATESVGVWIIVP